MSQTLQLPALPRDPLHHCFNFLTETDLFTARCASKSMKDVCDNYLSILFGGAIPLSETKRNERTYVRVDPFSAPSEAVSNVTKQFYLQMHWETEAKMHTASNFSPFYPECRSYQDLELYLETFRAHFCSVTRSLLQDQPRKTLAEYPQVRALINHQLAIWIDQTAQNLIYDTSQRQDPGMNTTLDWAIENKLFKVIKAHGHLRTSRFKEFLRNAVYNRLQFIFSSAFYKSMASDTFEVSIATLMCINNLGINLNLHKNDKIFLGPTNSTTDCPLIAESLAAYTALKMQNHRLLRHLILKHNVDLDKFLSLCIIRESSIVPLRGKDKVDEILEEKLKRGNLQALPKNQVEKLKSLRFIKCLTFLGIPQKREAQQPVERCKKPRTAKKS